MREMLSGNTSISIFTAKKSTVSQAAAALRAARANRVLSTDKRHPYSKPGYA
jgi:hypothetical protein